MTLKQVIYVLNKQDIEGSMKPKEFIELFKPETTGFEYLIVMTSAKTGYGLDYLLDSIICFELYLKIKDGWNFEMHKFFTPGSKKTVHTFLLVLKRLKIKIPKFLFIDIVNNFIDLQQQVN